MNLVGLELFVGEGDLCPICYLKQRCKCGDPECGPRFERWIEYAANEQTERFASKALT